MKEELEEARAVVEKEALKVEYPHHNTEHVIPGHYVCHCANRTFGIIALVWVSQSTVLEVIRIDVEEFATRKSEEKESDNVEGRGKKVAHDGEIP